MRKSTRIATALGTLAVAGSTVLVAIPAPASAAGSPGCVTRAEYRQVHRGMSQARVRHIFETRGEFDSGHAGGYTRWYGACINRVRGGGDVGAYITFDGFRRGHPVLEKRFF